MPTALMTAATRAARVVLSIACPLRPPPNNGAPVARPAALLQAAGQLAHGLLPRLALEPLNHLAGMLLEEGQHLFGGGPVDADLLDHLVDEFVHGGVLQEAAATDAVPAADRGGRPRNTSRSSE